MSTLAERLEGHDVRLAHARSRAASAGRRAEQARKQYERIVTGRDVDPHTLDQARMDKLTLGIEALSAQHQVDVLVDQGVLEFGLHR